MELVYEVDKDDLLAGAVVFLKAQAGFKKALLKARIFLCTVFMVFSLVQIIHYGFYFRSVVGAAGLFLFNWAWAAPYSVVGNFKYTYSEAMRKRGDLANLIGKLIKLSLQDKIIIMTSPVGSVIEKPLSEVEMILASKKLVVICFNNDFQIVVPRGKVSSGSLPEFLDELTSRSVRIS